MDDAPRDAWTARDLHEPCVGRWSRVVAREFLRWLAVPAGMDWLDVGCGTGAVTQAILDHAAPRSVKGADPSPCYVEHARAHVTGRPVSFEVGGRAVAAGGRRQRGHSLLRLHPSDSVQRLAWLASLGGLPGPAVLPAGGRSIPAAGEHENAWSCR